MADLNTDVRTIKGIGEQRAKALEKLGITGNYRVAETENRFSAREGAVMIWTLKECG